MYSIIVDRRDEHGTNVLIALTIMTINLMYKIDFVGAEQKA